MPSLSSVFCILQGSTCGKMSEATTETGSEVRMRTTGIQTTWRIRSTCCPRASSSRTSTGVQLWAEEKVGKTPIGSRRGWKSTLPLLLFALPPPAWPTPQGQV